MNFLYPLVMSHYSLPCGNYKWLDIPCAQNFPKIATVEEKVLKGRFFEINCEIALEIHDSVNDFVFPLVTEDSLSLHNISLVEDGGTY